MVAACGSGMLPAVCGALCAPWRERLRCPQTAAHKAALLYPPPAAQGSLGQILTGFASSNPQQRKKRTNTQWCWFFFGAASQI